MFKLSKTEWYEKIVTVFVLVTLAFVCFDGEVTLVNKIIVTALVVLLSLLYTISLQLKLISAYLERNYLEKKLFRKGKEANANFLGDKSKKFN